MLWSCSMNRGFPVSSGRWIWLHHNVRFIPLCVISNHCSNPLSLLSVSSLSSIIVHNWWSADFKDTFAIALQWCNSYHNKKWRPNSRKPLNKSVWCHTSLRWWNSLEMRDLPLVESCGNSRREMDCVDTTLKFLLKISF